MNPSFKGFKESDCVNPRVSSQATIESQSELSDYDSTVESRETTPTRSYTPQVSTVQRRRKDSEVSVRRLIDHFSNSDSEASEGRPVQTRRKRSKHSDHIELPAGGEKELRKKMTTQVKANDTIRI